MENNQLVVENNVTLNTAIKNTTSGIGTFIAGLFQLNTKSSAILISGTVLGVLSGIPIIGWGTFLYSVVLGAFTVSLYINHSPKPAQYTDGLVLGAITGLLGSFLQLIIALGMALIYLIYSSISSTVAEPANPWQVPNQGMQMLSAVGTSGYLIMSSLFLFIPIILLAMLGGLLGVVWFEKRFGNSVSNQIS